MAIPDVPGLVDASLQAHGCLLPVHLHAIFLLCVSVSKFLLFIMIIGLGPTYPNPDNLIFT